MPQVRNDAPIGVFDCGLGGLTVLRAIAEQLPHEDLVYLGDSARVTYGTRSAQMVANYAQPASEQRIKLPRRSRPGPTSACSSSPHRYSYRRRRKAGSRARR